MISEAVYLHYLSALLDGDKKHCTQIVVNLIEQGLSLKEIYLELFQRSLYRIGQLWERERCSVAHEHTATKITQGLIELVLSNSFSDFKVDKLVIIACIDKEYHELGARMVAGLFEVHGWNTILLGACTPQKELLQLIKEKTPDLVGVSCSFYMNITRLIRLIESIEYEFPDQKILIGGQALAEGRDECLAKYQNVEYMVSLDQLEEYLVAVK